jgi:hypothetical protein
VRVGRIGVVPGLALVVLVALARVPAARAVGVEGPADAQNRFGVGLGVGLDQVGGHGRDLYSFSESYLHAETRLWGGLYLAGALSHRRDIASYSYALQRWEQGESAAAAQALVGYDGRLFHLSAGSWFYASSRDAGRFHAALLPYGVLRVRVGSLDGWHVNLRLLDGAPFTAEGAGPGLRLHLGLPPLGRHRLAGGLYTSLGEKVVGLSVSDEIDLRRTSARRLQRPSIRLGATLGTDIGHVGRPEISLFGGIVW